VQYENYGGYPIECNGDMVPSTGGKGVGEASGGTIVTFAALPRNIG